MATGETGTGSLSSALPSVFAGCRSVKEFAGTWRRTCDVKKQQPNSGLNWQEFALQQVSGQGITETTNNQTFQQLQGTLFQIEPTMSQIIIKMTDRLFRKLASIVLAKFGPLSANAMNRKEDEDYVTLFPTFATTNSPGSGNPMSFGYISSAVTNCESNVTEGSDSAVYSVLHGRQVKDIQDEIVAGVGTYIVQGGMTEDTFRRGFKGMVAGSNVFTDNNITVDSTPNANGATHAREGVVACVGMEIKKETDRDIYFGGGADVISLVEEYAFAERKGGTGGTTQIWAYRHQSDATAPTS